ncbi:hypothetical protein ES703_89410 [subsurface metagenome]
MHPNQREYIAFGLRGVSPWRPRSCHALGRRLLERIRHRLSMPMRPVWGDRHRRAWEPLYALAASGPQYMHAAPLPAKRPPLRRSQRDARGRAGKRMPRSGRGDCQYLSGAVPVRRHTAQKDREGYNPRPREGATYCHMPFVATYEIRYNPRPREGAKPPNPQPAQRRTDMISARRRMVKRYPPAVAVTLRRHLTASPRCVTLVRHPGASPYSAALVGCTRRLFRSAMSDNTATPMTDNTVG